MNITVHSSKIVKPDYDDGSSGGGDGSPAAATAGEVVVIPLTVFDEVNHDEHVPGVFAFHPPSPPIAALEAGLAKVLAEYREWAGRLVVVTDNAGPGSGGKRAICLNDAGARLVEASADVPLAAVMPLQMGPEAAKLHPRCDDDGAEELMLVQVTRFPCGSFAVGCTTHHSVADGYATVTFLLAWGQATLGVRAAGFVPVPVHDRTSLFVPRRPPLVEFEHRGAEFKEPRTLWDNKAPEEEDDDEVIVQTVHFSRDFIAELKSRASAGAPARKPRSYSAAQCVVAHLWRCITKARGLAGHEVTRLHIAVSGRRGRMTSPRVPEGYTGNAVLWARPAATARELAAEDTPSPLRHAAELVSRTVARVDDRYFRSFIDFASSGAVEREGLVRTAASSELVGRTDVEVDSLLGLPFYELDFGTGKPALFVPSYSTRLLVEGAVFLVPAPPGSAGDGGVVAYVPLFARAVDTFRRCCYSLPPVAVAWL